MEQDSYPSIKMRVDLHNHTTFCNHANGSMEEYVLKAIEQKIDVFGFSEHAPMYFDEKYRLPIEKKALYESKVLELKEKYKEQIEILLAYEVDYIEGYILDEIISSNVDYLIGSVHFIKEKDANLWGFDNPEFIGKYSEKNIDTIWQEYFEAIESMANSKLFDVVGHLDLIKVFKYLPTKNIQDIAYNALQAIKESDMVLEINAAGLRKPIAQPYPSKQLLQQAYDLGIDITFSSDAHEIDQVGFAYDEVIKLAKEVGYTHCALFKNRKKQLVTF